MKNQVLKKKLEADAARNVQAAETRGAAAAAAAAPPRLKGKGLERAGGGVRVSKALGDDVAASGVSPRTLERGQSTTTPPPSDDWGKIHESLTRKSRLYEELQRGGGPLSGSADVPAEALLVDFDRKGWDEGRKAYVGLPDFALRPSEGLSPLQFLSSLYNVELGQALVEYVDEFGRTRLIRPEERQRLEEEREDTRQLLSNFYTKSAAADDDGRPPVPVHYEADREIRTKGVGFFTFAKDERVRQQQLQGLVELRRQTVEERHRALLLGEERRLRILARREKAERRRRALDERGTGNPL